MNTEHNNDWIIECPCGHIIHATDAKRFRGAGGKYLDREVEHHAIDNHIEIQCPKCLLWIDSTTGEIND